MNTFDENKPKQNKRTLSLIIDTVWFAIGSFGSKILAFMLVPLYTDILTTSEYGVADIIFTTVELAVPVFMLSVHDAVFRYAMDKEYDKNEVLSSSLIIVLTSPVILLAFYPLLRYLLPDITEYWWYFWMIFILNGLVGLMGNFLKATDRTKLYALQGILYTFAYATSNILFLAIFKIGLKGYLLSFLIGSSVSIIFMFFAGKMYRSVSFRLINKSLLKSMLRYCIPLIPASVAWWVMASIDKYMLLYMCGSEANGLYSVAHKIPTIITTVMTFFVNSWQIAAIKGINEDDIAEYTLKLYNNIAILGIIATGVLNLISQPIGMLLFKKDFYAAWTMSPSLSVSTLFSTLSLMLSAQFTAYKRSDLHFISNIIAMTFNILFNILLITALGIDGAAIGTMLSFFILMLYRQYKVKQLMAIKYYKRNILAFVFLIVGAVWTSVIQKYYYIFGAAILIICILLYRKEIKELIKYLTVLLKMKIRSRKI